MGLSGLILLSRYFPPSYTSIMAHLSHKKPLSPKKVNIIAIMMNQRNEIWGIDLVPQSRP